MPELPEVETIMRGLKPRIENLTITDVIVRQPKLRWPVPGDLKQCLTLQKISNISRRGKYLLLQINTGTLIIHLGMSGKLLLIDNEIEVKKHDHVDILFGQQTLRYHDPRRFGTILWTEGDSIQHPLLKSIGIEPFDAAFTGEYLFKLAQKRRVPIKLFIMNSKIVAGVGNIYANEALFAAKIHPHALAGEVSLAAYERLTNAIKTTLTTAIAAGGTTLKDYVNSNGAPGYFSQKLAVYGRGSLPCNICNTVLEASNIGQRATVFCPACQKHC